MQDIDTYPKEGLKERVQQKIADGLKQVIGTEYFAMEVYITALQEHLYEMGEIFNWDTPRTEIETKTIVGSSIGALQLALIETGRDPESNFQLTDPDKWWSIIKDVLDNTKSRVTFIENLWRSPMLVSPMRGLPLQYILRFHFGDNPINIVDLGAGLHVTLPLINSRKYLSHYFPGKELIEQYSKPVQIQTGLGIDKQERESSLQWAMSCYWPDERNIGAARRLSDLYRESTDNSIKFPFLQNDILKKNTNIGTFNTVFSSFIRHQLGEDQGVQDSFKQQVINLLVEGGIWVDIGEELILNKPPYGNLGVRVYKKQNENLVYVGEPFQIINQADIQVINLSYFNR
ncbi:MAG: hypothetical protein WCO33_01825 [bacterium]